MSDQLNNKYRFDNRHYQGSTFPQALFGKAPCRLSNCKFEDCAFSGLRFGVVEFNDCVFDNCRLEGVDFGPSSFVGGAFIGKIEDVWFRGRDTFTEFAEGPNAQQRTNEMVCVSFERAELWDVTFSDQCCLSTVVLPADREHYLLDRWQERLNASLATIATWNHSGAYNFIAAFLPHAMNQMEYIVNRKELVVELGELAGQQVLEALLAEPVKLLP